MSDKNKTVVFLDTLGRTIIGEVCESKTNNEYLVVVNPCVLNIVPTQTGTMSVQIIPLLFREILADRSEDVIWFYNKNSIVENLGVSLEFRIVAQYKNIVNAGKDVEEIVPEKEVKTSENKKDVIKLFDDVN